MNISETELQEILQKNPSVRVHGQIVKALEPSEYYILQEKKITTSKYKNRKTKIDGILFDSKKEADYYYQLKVMLQAGKIQGFCRQPEFLLQEGTDDMQPIRYKADFIVFSKYLGVAEIWDVKPSKDCQTKEYKLKKKMFKAKYPHLEIIEKY